MLGVLIFSAALSQQTIDADEYRYCKADEDCVAVMGLCTYQPVNKKYADQLKDIWRAKWETGNIACVFREGSVPAPDVECVNQKCERK